MNVVRHPSTLETGAQPVLETPVMESSPPARRRVPLRVLAAGVAGMAVFGAALWGGWNYWTVWRFEQSTDDAYVQADVVAIAPQVSGVIAKVLVTDNQPVRAGDSLAIIDQDDYRTAVDQAEADVDSAIAGIASISAELDEQQSLIEEARSTVESDKAALLFAEQTNQRFGTLANKGFGTVEEAQRATAGINSARALLAKDEAALAATQKQVATLNAQMSQAKALLKHNKAVLQQARLNLGHTVLKAPVDGLVGMRSVRVGLFVQPGTDLLAVVPVKDTYIIANYKETQLAGVRPGQAVRIDVDTFAGTPVRGVVDSIAPASGQVFSLLPPDNATGNFTKVVQRIPVKIRIDRTDPLAGYLLPGMSVTATIELDRAGPKAAAGKRVAKP